MIYFVSLTIALETSDPFINACRHDGIMAGVGGATIKTEYPFLAIAQYRSKNSDCRIVKAEIWEAAPNKFFGQIKGIDQYSRTLIYHSYLS